MVKCLRDQTSFRSQTAQLALRLYVNTQFIKINYFASHYHRIIIDDVIIK